jgi:hypothetical protein
MSNKKDALRRFIKNLTATDGFEKGFNKIIFAKSTLPRRYSLEGEKRRKDSMGLKNTFNFPFSPGKQWKHMYSVQPIIIKGYKTCEGYPTLDY